MVSNTAGRKLQTANFGVMLRGMGKPLRISIATLLEQLHMAGSAGEAARSMGMYNATTLKRICYRIGGQAQAAYEAARERGWSTLGRRW